MSSNHGTALGGALVLACLLPASLSAQGSVRTTDDLGRDVVLDAAPARIVSLVPAITEILFAIEAGDRLVGRSVWDDHPPEVREIPSVGDALRADAERVLARRPDLVLLYAGSDNARTVEQFERLGIPALALRIDGLDDLERNTLRLGRLLGRDVEAAELWSSIRCELETVGAATAGLDQPTVYYDVAWPPAITIGAGSYLDSLISLAGGRNVFHDLEAPSPQVALEAIAVREPDLILVPRGAGDGQVSPAERPGWSALEAVRGGQVRSVDADLLHRLGPRVGGAARSLAHVLHPGIEIDEAAAPAGRPGRGDGCP